MKTFFLSRKKTLFSSFFPTFPTFKVFWFSPKNFKSRAEKTFLRNNTIWYAFYSKFGTLIDFEKKSCFFLKKPISFSVENPKFWTFWEFLLFQSHSTANLLQFGERNSCSVTWTYCRCWRERNWQTSGKKVGNRPFEGKILLSSSKEYAQSNKAPGYHRNICRLETVLEALCRRKCVSGKKYLYVLPKIQFWTIFFSI